MNITRVKLILLIYLFLIVGQILPISVVFAAEDVLTVGVFPRRSAIITHKFYKPIMSQLSQELGKPIKLVTVKSFKIFWQDVKKQRYDLVHFNQYHYVASHKKFGYDVILMNEEFNRSTLTGTIVIRKDSGIKSVMDLKDKTIVFGGGPKAMISYIVGRYILEKNGLAHGSYIEKFSNNPPNAIFAAYRRQAAAAGSGDLIFDQPTIKKNIKINELKHFLSGPQLAHLPWAVNKSLSKELRKEIQDNLIGLKKTISGKKLLKAAAMTGFVKAVDLDYNPHREIIYTVLGERY